MYFIIRGRKDTLPTDPKVRKAAVDAFEKADSVTLKEAAKLRRDFLKLRRLADGAERADLVEMRTEQMRAIRRNMERRIND
jgi:hypothetical protein